MPTPLGNRVSYGQLEWLWTNAGGPAHMAPIMAAIAEAESRGYPGARNPSGASGLWQILGAPRGMPANSNWFDPEVNARAAVLKWQQQGLGAWTTYTSGVYKKFLQFGVNPQPVAGGALTSYRNPLRNLRGLVAERIDMGVDFRATSGPIYPLGPGVITAAGHAWSGAVGAPYPGTWITERITAGPLKGRSVYVAEDIFNIRVRPGQRVTTGTVLGDVRGGIETGFAAPGPSGLAGETAAAAAGQAAPGGDPGARPTAYGVAYSDILHQTGAPAGVGPASGGTGTLPTWLTDIIHAISPISNVGGAAGGIAGALGSIGSAIQGLTDWLGGLDTAITWLINPANQIRIIAGIAGGVLMLGGTWTLSHTGQQIPTPLGSVAMPSMTLPIGILEVGAGGVLLFIAFHNLDIQAGPGQWFGATLSALRTQAQGASAPAMVGGSSGVGG